jgi:hypothetical protein
MSLSQKRIGSPYNKGIVCHYAPLAIISVMDGTVTSTDSDCRTKLNIPPANGQNTTAELEPTLEAKKEHGGEAQISA